MASRLYRATAILLAFSLTSIYASAAEFLVNFGGDAYMTDGANTWQTFDIRNGGSDDNGLANISGAALSDSTGAASGITFSLAASSSPQLFINNPTDSDITESFGWFDDSVAEQRQNYALGPTGNGLTYTFSGFTSSDSVSFEFLVARDGSGGTGSRIIDVTSSYGGLLHDNKDTNLGGLMVTETVTGATSYTYTLIAQPGSGYPGSINALRIYLPPPPPGVSASIRAPYDGRTIYGNTPLAVEVEAEAVGTTVDRVELSVDGVLFSSDDTAPYSFDLGLIEPGTGNLILEATTYGVDASTDTDSVTLVRSPLYRGELYLAAMQHALSRCGDMTASIPTNRYPTELDTSGNWLTETAGWWTNGYWPGLLWMLYGFTDDSTWSAEAAARQAGLASFNGPTDNIDSGTIVWTTYGKAYKYTGNSAYRDIAVTAGSHMNALFDPDVGTTRSWSWGSWASGTNFTTIIDNNMSLELIYSTGVWTGNQTWLDQAETHSLTSIQQHIRPDNSTYHVVVFDENTGAVKFKDTHQGYSVNSTWSRGQGWGIYGFSLAYGFTGNPAILQAARDVSDWFIDQTWERPIPPWDFAFVNNIDNNAQDSIAAALAASGFLKLSDYLPTPDADGYIEEAAEILDALSAPPYLTTLSGEDSVITYASDNVPENRSVDTGILYADYYYVEALLRYFERKGGGSYALWQGNAFGFENRGQADTLPGADPGSDGIANLWHYLTHTPDGGNLTFAHRARLPRARTVVDEGTHYFEVVTQIVEARGDVTLTLELYDSDTGQWTTQAIDPTLTPLGSGRVEWSYRLPMDEASKITRLRATLNP